MASTYSSRLKLELMEAGANTGTWGNNTNENLQVIDASIGGYLSKSVAGSANVTLTTANRDADVETTNEAGNKVIDLNGTLSGNIYVFLPAVEKEYTLFNNTAGSHTLQVAPTGHAANNVTLTQGAHTTVYVQNGNKVIDEFAANVGTTTTTYIGNGANLTGIQAFASGTKMLFQQTAAPTGWTKDTSHNNKALRITSGSVTTGGSVAFTDAFKSQTVTISGTTGGSTVSITGSVASHTLTVDEIPAHNHLEGGHVEFGTGSSQSAGTRNTGNSSGAKRFFTADTGGGQGHTHAAGTLAGASHTHSFSDTDAVDLTVQYVDVIIAAKD